MDDCRNKFYITGQVSASLLTLAFLVQLSLSSVVLVVPLLMLLVGDPISRLASPSPIASNLKRTIPMFIELLAYSGILVFASTLVSGGWTWIPQTWGVGYVTQCMIRRDWAHHSAQSHLARFDTKSRFMVVFLYWNVRPFPPFLPCRFLDTPLNVCFSCLHQISVSPSTTMMRSPHLIRDLRHDPLYATFILLGVLGSFKAYLTLADPGLFLSMISLFPETFPCRSIPNISKILCSIFIQDLRHPIVTALLHLHSSLLLPLFHHLWLGQGTGNANFFYAITLVLGVSNGAALIDSVYAGLRIAIGEDKDGHAVIQE